MKTIDAFRSSLSAYSPPDVAPALQALWWLAKGDWDAAHKVCHGTVALDTLGQGLVGLGGAHVDHSGRGE